MKSVTSTILDEQVKLGTIPAVKIDIQAYDFPDNSSAIRFGQYDWHNVYANAGANDARACSPSDGSLILSDYSASKLVRFASVNYDADFTSWNAAGTATWNAPAINYDIIADPNSAEVMQFRVTYVAAPLTWPVEYNKSTDYGVTWGGWTALTSCYTAGAPGAADTNHMPLCAAYKSNGDICLLVGSYCVKRESGTWTYDGDGTNGWHQMSAGSGPAMLTTVTNVDMAYDGDFLIIADDGGSTNHGIFGDGGVLAENVDTWYGSISLTASTKDVNTFSDITSFSSHPHIYPLNVDTAMKDYPSRIRESLLRSLEPVYRMVGVYTTAGQAMVTTQQVVAYTTGLGYSSIIKIGNNPVILSLCNGDEVYFLKMRGDSTFDEGLFTDAFQLSNVYSLFVCANTSYLFAYNGNQIFMSPLPTYWAIPTVGTGASGSYEATTSSILSIQEVVNANATSTLDVTLDNSAGTYDSPGTGDLSVLDEDSRISLYLGFSISTVDTTYEYARYFIKDWDYSREPNLNTFTLHCRDAWGLLEEYTFPKQVRFNIYTNEYTIYELIEKCVQAIGGTLSYDSRSSSITSLYPKIQVNPQDTAANLLRRLLELVPDTIKFFGNDGTIRYPQSSDDYEYKYLFPM